MMDYKRFRVDPNQRKPLLDFMLESLVSAGARILHWTPPNEAPFRIAFETAIGERMGILAYAFLATRTPTKNRPLDERSFQIKYGSKRQIGEEILWQDPFGLYTTILVGIDPTEGFFVGPDPAMHNPTKMFIRFEFKDENVTAIKRDGWHVWERVKRSKGLEEPVEVVIGATRENFLQYVYFERAAKDLSQGDRFLLAEKANHERVTLNNIKEESFDIEPRIVHPLAQEFQMTADEILQLISGASRLKMAVRGWVAEKHLIDALRDRPGVSECSGLTVEGGPDIQLRYEGGPFITIECKNVLRRKTAEGLPKVDFQRTRASKADACSRYYSTEDFDVVAACLHAVTEEWKFKYILPVKLRAHGKCPGKITNNIQIDELWSEDPSGPFSEASRRKLGVQ
jgi:hypothetical protein